MGSMCFKASEGTGGRNSNWANAPNLVEIRASCIFYKEQEAVEIVQKPVAEEKKVMFSVLSSSFLNVPFQIDYVFAKYMKYVRNEVKTKNVMALGKLTRLPALEAARMGANVWLIGKEYSSDLEAALGAVEEKLEGTLTIERNVPRVSEMKAELGLLTWDYYFERRCASLLKEMMRKNKPPLTLVVADTVNKEKLEILKETIERCRMRFRQVFLEETISVYEVYK